jgi:uncharacterized protein
MNLQHQINDEIKAAMKSGNKLRLETLRSIRAGIIEFEKSGAGREMTNDDGQKILSTAAKRRKDAAEQFQAAGRADLAEKELAELAIIQEFLPQQVSDAQLETELRQLMEIHGVNQAAQFGKLMGVAIKHFQGTADGSRIQAIAKTLLES